MQTQSCTLDTLQLIKQDLNFRALLRNHKEKRERQNIEMLAFILPLAMHAVGIYAVSALTLFYKVRRLVYQNGFETNSWVLTSQVDKA